MNDFTKEELQVLSEYLDYPIKEIVGTEGKRLNLAMKIELMIDNYCEHEIVLKHEPIKQCQCCKKLWRF